LEATKVRPKFVKLDFKLTPLEIFTRLFGRFEYVYILESVEGPEKLAEYSFIGFHPKLHLIVKNSMAKVYAPAEESEVASIQTSNPLSIVRTFVGDGWMQGDCRLLGGAVGYISYDAVRYWEELPKAAIDDLGFPDLEVGIFNDGIIFNHKTGEAFYYYMCENRLDEVLEATGTVWEAGNFSYSKPESNFGKEEFEDIVLKAKEYIASGDVFQVVLSKRYMFRFSGSLIPFYKALRMINPSPYMYYLKMGERQIVGSSPEMLVRVEGRTVETFPIAGTRPRTGNPAKDKVLLEELTRDPKECAEHVMLVDLARNDIGKVSDFGSVTVEEFMKVYSYSHVQHMVSKVVGKLKPQCTCYDALMAVFPAGTVSGAPKVRAMEIIEELEPVRRGPYAGAVGYFSYNGNADFAITIRTLVADGDRAYIQTGAGIVADSIPEKEWFETEHKASALMKALKIAAGEENP
jgi:anthranilate synthase component 1